MSRKDKQYALEIKAIDEQNMIIDMVGSTADVDRVGDVIAIDGVDYSDYMKNPIVLPNHDYSSQAIGKTLSITPTDNKLIFKIQFAATEIGQEWFYLYSKGFMSSSSIGFIPIEYSPNDSGGYTYTKIQLLEISLVTVPCQQNANILRAFKDGKISKALFDCLKKEEEVISKDSLEEIAKACTDIESNINSIRNLIEGLACEEEKTEEYTEEEINKAVEENIKKILGGNV